MSIDTTSPTEDRSDIADAFLPGHWFAEFRQDYADGIQVLKRGLEASPLVVRKYDIGADEVLAMSTHMSRRRAMTVFHFHPEFAANRRRAYMDAHLEGRDLAIDIWQREQAEMGERRAMILRRVARARRAVGVAAQAAVVFLLAHYSSGR